MNNDPIALVILSGGQDSTIALRWAIDKFEDVMAVTFNYNQKHSAEIFAAKHIATALNVRHEVISIAMPSKSSLTQHNLDSTKQHPQDSNLPASFTAARNLIFIANAGAIAYDNNIEMLVMGVCQTDYSGYPDCRNQFIHAAELALSLATDKDFNIYTPLMYMTKAETWRMAKQYEIVDLLIEHTLTCYNGNEKQNEWGKGCGNCPACKLRAKGWKEAVDRGWL